MRYTLLEIVQSVLSSMDSDEVNSITDTVESLQVVEIVKTVYDDIVSRSDIAIQKTLFNLNASGSALKPVIMTKPTTIENIDWVRYNRIKLTDTTPAWEDIRFMPLDQFIMMVQGFSPTLTNVGSLTHTANGFTFTLNFNTDRGPTYYSSFDDNTLIFDSYNSTVDTTLQTNKTLCYGTIPNNFQASDSWIPNLQAQQFSLLLNEAKALAWAELKQTTHAKAEQSARRNWVHVSKTRRHIPTSRVLDGGHPFRELPNFGRKRR